MATRRMWSIKAGDKKLSAGPSWHSALQLIIPGTLYRLAITTSSPSALDLADSILIQFNSTVDGYLQFSDASGATIAALTDGTSSAHFERLYANETKTCGVPKGRRYLKYISDSAAGVLHILVPAVIDDDSV